MSSQYSHQRKTTSEIKKMDGNFDTLISAINSKDLKTIALLLKRKSIELIDTQNYSVLHLAARLGDTAVLKLLLDDERSCKLLERAMYNGDTPLLAAARYGNLAAAKLLIEYGAEIHNQNIESRNTVLHFAACCNDSGLMNLLLSRSLPDAFVNAINLTGETALEIAIKKNSPTLQVLLQAGVDYKHSNPFTRRNVLHTSVAYNQCDIVQKFLSLGRSQNLTDIADNRGDTPLMLAIRIRCLKCVKILMNNRSHGKEINKNTKESILHIAVDNEDDEILRYVLMNSHKDIVNHQDNNGMTPLLYAIEHDKDKCLQTLIKTQNVFTKNKLTQETALHAAIRVENINALYVLFTNNNANAAMRWSLKQKDKNGKTPFWLALECGNAAFLIEARKRGWVNIDELNSFGDSPTFVAAASGHLQVLKAMLLSERYYEFCWQHEKDPDFKDYTLVRNAEICCDIYNSDIYILTGKTKKNKQHTWHPKSLMSINNRTGQNIFHACALGGNLRCLEFIHNYFKLFLFGLDKFDKYDVNGNTPLLLSTRNLGQECVHYFLSNGANISSQNKAGETVLRSLLVHTINSGDLLMSILNDGIIYDASAMGEQEESKTTRFNFSLLKPPNEPVTKTVKLFYDSLESSHRNKLLQHKLFKTYVKLILSSVNYFFLLRFLASFFFTSLLSVYVVFYAGFSEENAIQHRIIIGSFKFMLGVLSVFGLLCSLPLIIHGDLNYFGGTTYSLMVLPSILVLYFIFIPYGSELSFEIAALAVLVSWISLLMYSTTIFKKISHQIFMLLHVIQGMIVYFKIVFLILLPFSISFYCIFNDNNYFENPIKSLIYTSFILLQGDTMDSFEYFEKKHWFNEDNQQKNNTTNFMSKTNVVHQLDMWFESMFLTCFLIMCVLGLLNMLVGLAVRDGKTLEIDGDIFRRRLQIHWLFSLEKFLGSFIYKVIRRTPIVYLLGIIPSRTHIDLGKNASRAEWSSIISLHASLTDFKSSVQKKQFRESVDAKRRTVNRRKSS